MGGTSVTDNTCKVCGARFMSRQELDHHNESAHIAGKKAGEAMSKEDHKEQKPM